MLPRASRPGSRLWAGVANTKPIRRRRSAPNPAARRADVDAIDDHRNHRLDVDRGDDAQEKASTCHTPIARRLTVKAARPARREADAAAMRTTAPGRGSGRRDERPRARRAPSSGARREAVNHGAIPTGSAFSGFGRAPIATAATVAAAATTTALGNKAGADRGEERHRRDRADRVERAIGANGDRCRRTDDCRAASGIISMATTGPS